LRRGEDEKTNRLWGKYPQAAWTFPQGEIKESENKTKKGATGFYPDQLDEELGSEKRFGKLLN